MKKLKLQNFSPRIQKLLSPLLSVIRVVSNAHMRTMSVELTYATILAIVPVLAILFTIAKSFDLSNILREQLENLLAPIGSAGEDVSQYLFQFIDNAQPGVLGPIGVLFLFYTAFGLIHKVEDSLNKIWQVNESRSIIRKVTRYSSALIYIVIAAMIAVTIRVGVWQYAVDSLSDTSLTPILKIIAGLVSTVITVLLLAMLYSSFPNTRVKLLPALIGGLFTALTWIPLTLIFAKTVAVSANYSAIYSSFASLVITLIWLQYAWILFLSGATLSYLVQYPIMMQPQSYRQLNPAELERYALQITDLLIDKFNDGKGSMHLSDMMHATKLSKPQLYSVLNPFLETEIIREIRDGEIELILNTSITNLDDTLILKTVRGEIKR